MPEPFAVAGADYLEQLLRPPQRPLNPSAGQVVARLMVALGAKGEGERLAPYLSGWSSPHSRFDVTRYDDADRPAASVTDLGAGQATRALVGFSAAHPNCAVVVNARDDSGDERCVLVGRGCRHVSILRRVSSEPAASGGGDEPTASAVRAESTGTGAATDSCVQIREEQSNGRRSARDSRPCRSPMRSSPPWASPWPE